MRTPFFSIIIPVYNTAQRYLKCCMDSVLSQGFSNYEVIIVDDGSTEQCKEFCDQYGLKDSRTRVIHQKNQGVSAARNVGIREARGEWIVFVDADDWLEPHALERLSQYLEEAECDILQFCAVTEFSSFQEKMVYGLLNGKIYRPSVVEEREFLYRRLMRVPKTKEGKTCPLYYSWDKAIKRTFLLNNGLEYPLGIPKSEDKVFFLKCFEKMRGMLYVEDELYHYRINSESATQKYKESADSDCKRLAEALMEIAHRMDAELGALKGQANYHTITDDCNRFVFGILTDVLFMKFYHPDYPHGNQKREADVSAFLKSEPFRDAIRACKYNELSVEAKLKKFLLSIGLASVFCNIRKTYRYFANKRAT